MSKTCITSIPVGPQHVVLPEPVHFNLHVEDEVVKKVDFKLGFAHRGIEKSFEKRDMYSALFIAERICGICSCSHSCAISGVLEKCADVQIPDNARYVRSMVLELDRVHSHLLILGHLAETMGYENLFMLTWRDREIIMDMLEAITGNRVNHNINTVGGVRKKITSAMAKELGKKLEEFKGKWEVLSKFYISDPTFRSRTRGVGTIPKQLAIDAGVVGPNARGSGVDLDIRNKHYFAYGDLKFKSVKLDDPKGDIYDRSMIRVKEVFESMKMIKTLLGMIDDSKPFVVDKCPKKLPKNEVFLNVEAPRGELFYYVKGNETNMPARMKVRTPTLATLRAVPIALTGTEVQNVALIVISIDPCICCTER